MKRGLRQHPDGSRTLLYQVPTRHGARFDWWAIVLPAVGVAFLILAAFSR